MRRIILNHGIVFFLFVVGGVLIVIGTGTIYQLVLPHTDASATALAAVLMLITWIFSWILRGLYISNRDLSIEEMGEITLKTYIGTVQQVYARKYGEK